ncbi:MAG: cell division protein FtsA [Patescibacteria group bacterium]|nr:cell division protein FtsA [Patescibacteria group bacterium]
MTQNNISVGIDVGSTKIITCVGKFENGSVDIIGLGKSSNQGVRKGVIVDIEETVSAISSSLEEAERMSGIPIQSAIVGISGPHIEAEESKGVIAVSRTDGEITDEDAKRAIDAAKAIPNKPNREVLHVIPKTFLIDGQEAIKDPTGMTGIRLEVDANIISTSTNALKSLTRSIDQAGLHIEEIVFSPIATTKVLLSKRQMDIGVILIDLGASTTSFAVYEEGDLLHCGVVPIGSTHITNDIAIGLRTNIDIAEMIKIKYGYAIPDKVAEKDEINLSKLDKNEEGVANAKYVSEIIEARLNEIFLMIKNDLSKIGRDGTLPAGVVLTGGGTKIDGIVELAKATMCLPAQIGKPIMEISGLVDKTDDPVYSTSIGLMLWGKDKTGGGNSFDFDVKNWNGILGKVRSAFKNFLP